MDLSVCSLKILAGYYTLTKEKFFKSVKFTGKKSLYSQMQDLIEKKARVLIPLSLERKIWNCWTSKVTEKRIAYWFNTMIYRIEDVRHRHLSLGTKQKMALIQALSSSILFDEPMNMLWWEKVRLTKQSFCLYPEKKNYSYLFDVAHIEDISDFVQMY